jgi:hypothetical protein
MRFALEDEICANEMVVSYMRIENVDQFEAVLIEKINGFARTIAMWLVKMHLDHNTIDVRDDADGTLEHRHLMALGIDLQQARPPDVLWTNNVIEALDAHSCSLNVPIGPVKRGSSEARQIETRRSRLPSKRNPMKPSGPLAEDMPFDTVLVRRVWLEQIEVSAGKSAIEVPGPIGDTHVDDVNEVGAPHAGETDAVDNAHIEPRQSPLQQRAHAATQPCFGLGPR